MTPAEKHAIGLYAVGARDVGDFLDMLASADREVLQLLHDMLTFPGTTKTDTKLNELLAPMVARALEKVDS
jgi:hypothetical protein